MNIRKIVIPLAILLAVVSVSVGCKYVSVKYSFTGTQIHADARTVSIPFVPNNAALIAPSLSNTVREQMQEKFRRQTRLDVVDFDGDLAFEIEVSDYRTTPIAISGDEMAQKNRLQITLRVSFVNNLEPEYSFSNRTFSDFEDYDALLMLSDVEDTLIPQIVEKLVETIFNESVANW